VWRPDSRAFFVTAEDRGQSPIWQLVLYDKQPLEFAPDLPADDLAIVHSDEGEYVFFSRASIDRPSEIAAIDVLQSPKSKLKGQPITHMNDALLSRIDMQPLEGAWGDEWTYRWNAELFAATGNYVVVMINFHGSTGYGQNFTDSISGDWGGKPYVDLMKGLDYVEKTYPFIDKNREAALGASYGGYMANWLLGHTNRFKCIVSHDGMFNAESAYGMTEELWFPNWEFGGPPWRKRDVYRKWSPHEYTANFKTPTLVVHGQLDYRLDVSQGFDLFTTLQVLKVPSKMLYFPDEGHWVLKPQNSRLWYKTVNDWVDQWCKK